MTATPGSLVLVTAPWFLPSPTPSGLSSKGSEGMSSKFCPHFYKQPRSRSTSLSQENREEKYFQDKNKLIDGGGFVVVHSSTLSGMTLTPFKIFQRCSKISSSISS
jgi:hypothetical protein